MTRRNERFFDHILVSPHFGIADAGYHHGWREDGLSDHSGVWVRLEPQ